MPVLVLQRGHVPRRSGSTGTEGEQALAIAVGSVVERMGGEVGWGVRQIDADEPDRAYRGDAFVAVHADGSDKSAARGASVGWQTGEGRVLGAAWKRAYVQCGWIGRFRVDNYTDALARYYGVGRAVGQGNKRAIIVECGFLTNPTERQWLQAHPHLIAESILWAVTGQRPRQQEEDVYREGDSGSDISKLQARLNDCLDQPPLDIDGIYGPNTRGRVAAFARRQGWPDHDGREVSVALYVQIAAYAHGVRSHAGGRL